MRTENLPPIVTATQMRAIDEYAISKLGISSLTLMENAGAAVARRIATLVFAGIVRGKNVAILCGPGNNGGDGFVVARALSEQGAAVTVYLVVPVSELKGDAKTNADRATEGGIRFVETRDSDGPPDLKGYDLIVDAIFGTGFHGSLTDAVAKLILAANTSGVMIASIDTPSGLDSDTGALAVPTIHATCTFTLASSKLGQWLWPGRSAVGELEVIDIGIPAEAINSQSVRLRQISADFIHHALPFRPPDGHKGTFGKAMIIGGSAGMSGAVVLAANACMRTGAGLTYAAVPKSLVDVVDAGAVEVVVRPLPEVGGRRVIARRALGEIVRLWIDTDAVAIGPGLSTHHETQELVRRLVMRREKPTVLDADGLNACAKDTSCLEAKSDVPLIITPHVGEMARLLGRDIDAIATDRLSAGREAAKRFHCIVVMKGAPTFVAEPGGDAFLNPTGNSGMASGGVGDVLTGILLSLLAQGLNPLTAAVSGVYLHGLAGDSARDEHGEASVVATDLVAHLPRALRKLGTG